MAYIRSQANGNYSNPATWVGGVVPGDGDFACTLTHRITLDIDPLAVLCVNKKDFSYADGTATTAFTGGFIVPTGAIRTVVGFRYDGTSTSATTSATTAALVLNGLTLNLGYLQIILDNVPTGTQSQYIVYVTGVAAVQQTLNITGFIDYCVGSGNFVSRYHTTLIYLAGVTNGNITVNLPALSPQSPDGLYSQGMGLLATNTAASGFTFNFNESIPAAVGSIKTANFFKCSFVTTGIDNQKVNFNAPVMGSGLAPVGSIATTIAFTTVSSVTAAAPLTIDMAYETGTSGPTYATFTDIRNSVSLSDLTLLGKVGSLAFLGMDLGSTFTCGNITLSNRLASNVFLNVTGEAEITLGNISCMSDTSAYTTVLAVALTTTQKVVVGNLSYGLSNLAHQPLLKITGVLTKPITLGSIDARNLYFQANTQSYSAVQINDITTDVITVNGNIYGSNFGTVSGNPGLPTNSAALNFLGSGVGNVSRVVINGDVYGGTKQSAIVTYAGIPVVFNITVKGKVVSPSSQTVPRIPFPHPIYAGASPVAVEEIDCGSNAMFPIVGFFSFIGMHSRISMMSETLVGTNEYITARFWRILMTENNGDTHFSLQEVNIIGANNLSLVSPATPTSQSSYYDGGWYQATASKLVDTLVDGGESDIWESSGANPTEWVSFDLIQPAAVKAFKLLPQVYAPVTVSRSPKVFKIQFSNDNVNWGDALLAENQTSWTAGVYNEYLLPYEPSASGGSGETNDLTSVLQKLDNIKKDTTFIKSIVA